MPDSTKLKLILGSASPRRKELLGYFNLPFEIDVPAIDENSLTLDPKSYVQEISLKKAQAIALRHQSLQGVIICSDTTVSSKGKILGKPQDINEARDHLTLLSGQVHQVYTALTLVRSLNEKQDFFTSVDVTEVEFLNLESKLLEEYLSTGDSLDKSGSYGIQGQAQVFVKSIKGSYSNVVGFPLHLFYEMMDQQLFKERQELSWLSLF